MTLITLITLKTLILRIIPRITRIRLLTAEARRTAPTTEMPATMPGLSAACTVGLLMETEVGLVVKVIQGLLQIEQLAGTGQSTFM
jgi:hypothetical protein